MKIKVTLIILLAVVLPVSKIQAQKKDSTIRLLPVGIKIGTNYSNMYAEQDDAFTADAKSGLAAGVFFPFSLGAFIGVQPELVFSQKGFKAKGNLLGSSYNFKRTTSYLDLPLLLALKPMPSLTLLAGPQFSYLLKQRDEWTTSTTSEVQEKELENDNTQKNTFCAIVGLDINVDHIVIGVRGGWDVSQTNGDGSATALRYKNTWLQTTLGYRF
jgi:Outer membrane protein beta-barrel domain